MENHINRSYPRLENNSNLNNWHIIFSAKHVLEILLQIIGFLVFANLLTQTIQHITPDFWFRDGLALLFYVDAELNFPSLYSALAILLASIILGAIAYFKKQVRDPFARHWQWLGIIFALLAFDEIASWHEKIINPLRALLNTSGFLRFAWVIPGSAFVLFFLVAFYEFIINLPHKTRNHFLRAGCVYITGCIGFEMLGGYVVENDSRFFAYLITVTTEETLEMLGIALFIYALLFYISDSMKGAICTIKVPKLRGCL